MATLNIGGQRVRVGDEFLSMSPEQQQATVEEIAASLGVNAVEQSQGISAEPPPGAVPGSREYADWAAQRARQQVSGGEAPNLPQVSANPNSAAMQYETALERTRQTQFPDMPDEGWAAMRESVFAPYTPTQQGMYGGTLGYGDEAGAIAPAIGSTARAMITGQGPSFGQAFEDARALEEARLNLGREQNGMLGGVLETAGALTAFGPGQQALASLPATVGPLTAGQLGKAALSSGTAGAVLGGAQGFGSTSGDFGERLQGAAGGAAAGAAIGAAAPVAAEAIRGGVSNIANRITAANQSRVTNQAIQGAPSAADLKSAASSMFQQVDNSGVALDPTFFGRKVMDMANKAGRELIDKELDAPAYRMYQIMADRTRQASEAGRGLSLGEIHNIRQIAQDVSISNSGRTARFAREVIDELDNMMASLKPDQLLGGTGADKGRVLLDGIGTWSRARKVGLIEEAMYKAQNQASGLENGLRIQFRQLLQNPNTRKLFTQAEKEAIERVVQGTTGSNLMKLIGKFGFGSGNASNMLGGSIGSTFGAAVGSPLGPFGSAVGAGIAGGGATLARRASEAMTNQAAGRAAQVVATPNIPQVMPALPPQRLNDILSGLGAYGGPLGISAAN